MKCYDTRHQLPVLFALAEAFVVCDNWYASMTGPTWPNRMFAHAGSSGGLDHSPSKAEIIEW
jgi:phospholipase C